MATVSVLAISVHQIVDCFHFTDLAERDRKSLIVRQPSISSTAPASIKKRKDSTNGLKAASSPDLAASIGSGYATKRDPEPQVR